MSALEIFALVNRTFQNILLSTAKNSVSRMTDEQRQPLNDHQIQNILRFFRPVAKTVSEYEIVAKIR